MNKKLHILNGNGIKFKLITWNKGNAYATNRISEIHQILHDQKPTILALQEFNLRDTDDQADLEFPEYSLELDTMIQVHGWSRTATYIHQSIKHSRRMDLEVPQESMVSITLHPSRAKPVNIINYYRQWQVCQPEGAIPDTNSIEDQTKRLKGITKKICQSMQENNTITLSDTNLDFSIDWFHPSTMNTSARKYNPLYRVFREDLFNQGMAVINTPPTKHYINQPDTTVDHLMTSSPDKILNHKILKFYNSDHYPIMFIWSQKGQFSGIRNAITRKFKNVDWNEIRSKLSQDVRLATATCSTDPNIIFSQLSSAIQDSLHEQAPPSKIQIKQKLPQFLTQETIDVIKKRDKAYKEAKQSGDIDNMRLFKNLRN